MTEISGILDKTVLASLMLRTEDLERSVAWYEGKLGWSPVHRGADGDTPPYAVFDVAGIIVTIWELWPDQHRPGTKVDFGPYPVLVYQGDVEALHAELVAAGVETDGLQHSANNAFCRFYDVDHNRWEVSKPVTGNQKRAARQLIEPGRRSAKEEVPARLTVVR